MKIEKLGCLMRAIRKLHGLSVREVASRMGLSPFRYFLIEQGWVEVDACHWFEFCRFLELPVDVIFELGPTRRRD